MVAYLSLYHFFDFDYCISVCASFTLFSFSCRFLLHVVCFQVSFFALQDARLGIEDRSSTVRIAL